MEQQDFQLKAIDPTIMGEIQLLLAEKRTSLSIMRTGIAVFALPMSVFSVLIATSKYYDLFHVLHLLIPLGLLNLALIVLGAYLIISSIIKMRRYDNHINQIKVEYGALREFIE
ncbi:hypothetical protein [Vibrio mangrovi]|uniref:Uncharacterized protein n=1 Tax=Vibrio mangrovi TaxID=474394 RepID=A0A1Y6J136_9VIBR|nr:hypothetical protein [Vibrio mangrovi]MDW6005117.1 hypothetical protein [Vibrio mangrovi]SMS02961.1 hypothetical protein VIM7927_04323 [Vibrio mangrovi]